MTIFMTRSNFLHNVSAWVKAYTAYISNVFLIQHIRCTQVSDTGYLDSRKDYILTVTIVSYVEEGEADLSLNSVNDKSIALESHKQSSYVQDDINVSSDNTVHRKT